MPTITVRWSDDLVVAALATLNRYSHGITTAAVTQGIQATELRADAEQIGGLLADLARDSLVFPHRRSGFDGTALWAITDIGRAALADRTVDVSKRLARLEVAVEPFLRNADPGKLRDAAAGVDVMAGLGHESMFDDEGQHRRRCANTLNTLADWIANLQRVAADA